LENLMKRLALAAALFVLSAFSAHAQQAVTVTICGSETLNVGQPYALSQDAQGRLCLGAGGGGGVTGSFTPLSPMQSGLAITLATTLTIPSGATYAVVCAEGQNVRYSTDGTTTPTASVGMLLLQNQCISLSGPTVLSNFKAIQAAATATLDASYFK
jgi:opacity protein-like surface antigen